MQKLPFKPIALITLLSLGIVACGSSGGGTKPATTNAEKPTTEKDITTSNQVPQETNTQNSSTNNSSTDTTQLNTLKTRLETIEKQLNTLTANPTDNNAQLNALIAELQTQKTYLEEEQKKLKDQLTELKQQKEKLIQQRNELSQLADNKEKLIQEKEKALIEKENIIREKENILTAHIEASNDKDRQISELYSRISDLESQLWNHNTPLEPPPVEDENLPEIFKDFKNFSTAVPDKNELNRVDSQSYIAERSSFVGELFHKDVNTKINEDAIFLPLDIPANGYRTDKVYKNDGQYQMQKVKLVEKIKDFVDNQGKNVQIRISQKSYNLEDAGISQRNWFYLGYREMRDDSILSYGGVPTLASNLETLSGNAIYKGKVLGIGYNKPRY
ncbi:hypothetical protein [Gallibacterium sp. AGMB14963]|uniref:hypothetical protein n=1 Tax=Gallibacterium faecale TaxID=3019086 RepID=UPI0022F1D9F2|nr:hypothetical protein [Gallibacterium sp. AGMB14963]MDA3979193.1 hypothetical protein [Gallibacterium sp. AGMB14963]